MGMCASVNMYQLVQIIAGTRLELNRMLSVRDKQHHKNATYSARSKSVANRSRLKTSQKELVTTKYYKEARGRSAE